MFGGPGKNNHFSNQPMWVLKKSIYCSGDLKVLGPILASKNCRTKTNGWIGVNCILAASDMSGGPGKNNHFSNYPMWVVKNLFIAVVIY